MHKPLSIAHWVFDGCHAYRSGGASKQAGGLASKCTNHCQLLTGYWVVAMHTGQEVPADKLAVFQHTYTLLMAFLAAVLPPVITDGVDDAPPTAHEKALSKLPGPPVLTVAHQQQLVSTCFHWQLWKDIW